MKDMLAKAARRRNVTLAGDRLLAGTITDNEAVRIQRYARLCSGPGATFTSDDLYRSCAWAAKVRAARLGL